MVNHILMICFLEDLHKEADEFYILSQQLLYVHVCYNFETKNRFYFLFKTFKLKNQTKIVHPFLSLPPPPTAGNPHSALCIYELDIYLFIFRLHI